MNKYLLSSRGVVDVRWVLAGYSRAESFDERIIRHKEHLPKPRGRLAYVDVLLNVYSPERE
jgi:hypothetical protein